MEASLARFAQHVQDFKEAVVIVPSCESTDKHSASIARVGEDILVKYGPYVSAKEEETFRFISERTSVPVPHVYGVHEGDDGNTYIVMEFITGDFLDEVWDSLETEQKIIFLVSCRRSSENSEDCEGTSLVQSAAALARVIISMRLWTKGRLYLRKTWTLRL